ncbi:MAG: hypothetical protein RLZZ444_3825, partial [Pseudomonadota bacterium]
VALLARDSGQSARGYRNDLQVRVPARTFWNGSHAEQEDSRDMLLMIDNYD